MTPVIYWSSAAFVFLVIAIVIAVRYQRGRAPRLVTCPATREPARVALGGVSAILDPHHARLSDCSNWPERASCAQRCLSQVESAPDGCLVRNLVAQWYWGKRCAFCRKTFGAIDWYNQPALLDSDGQTWQWNRIRIEDLPEVLARSQPVCWNCHVTEGFCRAHPELVTLRRA